MDDTAYWGWLRVIAASLTEPELAVLMRRLRQFPESPARDELLGICEARSRTLFPAAERTRVGSG